MKSTNKILRRYYVEADLKLATPLNISNGLSENTDSDVLKSSEGTPFIPGTSIAGAFRNYLGQKKTEDGVFGFADGEIGRMSSLWIMDAYLKQPQMAVRDGVQLNTEKTVENKFDYEVVETGAVTMLRMEKVVRERDVESIQEEQELDEIRMLLSAIDRGEIRFGSKRTRGLGWMTVMNVRKRKFEPGDSDWLTFCERLSERENLTECPVEEKQQLMPAWDDWKKECVPEDEKYIRIAVPLKLTGGISIRRYSARPGEVDYEHITIRDRDGEQVPVIPGSSWNGAVRACVRRILQEVQAKEINRKIDAWFGFVDKKQSQQSSVIFKESILENSVSAPVMRNCINRFDASASDGALYSERTCFGGQTVLEILVRKSGERQYRALLGILFLVLQEIEEGFLPIGGQTAIGRGIFEKDETGEVEYSEEVATLEKREICMKELAYFLTEKEG